MAGSQTAKRVAGCQTGRAACDDAGAGRGERVAADILVFGTGNFAGRILCDLAAAAADPVEVVVAGRNEMRLAWLRTAANARTLIFGRAGRFEADRVDLRDAEALAAAIARHRPKVVVQAASAQPASVIAAQGNRWSRLVAEGGLSVTAVFQAEFSLRVLRALGAAGHACHFVNCCFPDVVNALLTAAGHRVTCGIGNVGILATAFAAEAGIPDLRVLAHYQTITPFRSAPDQRVGPFPRVWIGDEEIEDVAARFGRVQLTPEPALDISGACGVPLLLAMAREVAWRGHVPGPGGRVGGYPVRFDGAQLALDLPPGVMEEQAVAWNRRFEEGCGLVVEDGGARYSGRLLELLAGISPELAQGFAIAALDAVRREMETLRSRLLAEP